MSQISTLVHMKLNTRRTMMVLQAILAISVILLSGLSTVAPVKAQSITGSLTFTRAEDNAFTGVIDTTHGFAYFATDTVPGMVVKVRLSDFTKVGTLVMNRGESFLSAGVIDPANDFAYFGSFSFPGHIIKVRLSDLTRVGSIDIPRVGAFTTAIVDTVNGYAYFGSFFSINGQGSVIVKVNLSTFTVTGTLQPPNGLDLFGSTMDTNGFGYFSTFAAYVGASPEGIFKIRLSDLTLSKTLMVGTPMGATPLMDGSNTFSYWPTLTNPGSILRVRNSDLTLNATLTMNPGEADLNSGVIDTAEGFAYFATGGGFSDQLETPKVIKINLATFRRVSTLTLAPYESLQFVSAGGVIQTEADGGSFAYFSSYTSPSYIIKVKLSNMSRAGTLQLQQGEEYLRSSVIDTGAGYVYFPSDALDDIGNGTITRIRISDFSNAGILHLPAGEGPICSGVIDTAHGFAYFATRTTPAKIIKVRLSDFSPVGAISLNPGETTLCAAVIDTVNGFAYFGTYTSPSKVVKIRLSDFTRVGAIQLASPSEDFILSAVIDVNAGFAYFGTDQFPGVISKVRLSDFTEVASLTLNGGNFGEDEVATAVIDPAGNFAYFGTLDSPGVVVKVRLSDFSENMSLTLAESYVEGSVIDPTHGFTYFATQGAIVKVQLSPLTEIGSTPIANPAVLQVGGSIDIAGGTAYFGTNTNPGTVYKVSL
ncbi:hypothetical protein E6H27_08295 [Candidatus Bathyarchaeota archaeon]|nr:MAG: hypothetical protein E6H27_08295 [Candidatus Bathyarchaeota archaeon]